MYTKSTIEQYNGNSHSITKALQCIYKDAYTFARIRTHESVQEADALAIHQIYVLVFSADVFTVGPERDQAWAQAFTT
jgi:hypothetical protein